MFSKTTLLQTLKYEDGTEPCYNGNISEMTVAYNGGSPIKRSFTYDRLNRLTAQTSTDGYNTAYTYNLNSSPRTIMRCGLTSDGTVGTVDDLALAYNGNRLASVTDYADPVLLESSLDFPSDYAWFGYNADGNLNMDISRDITGISYSPGGMPMAIDIFGDDRFEYSYDALNCKLAENYRGKYPTSSRYYVGSLEFIKEPTDTAPLLVRANLPWGYLDANGRAYAYITDYQGNIRAVVDADGTAIQTTDYYPYGLPMATSTAPAVNRYKYGAKEFETRNGLNFHDFEARMLFNDHTLFGRPDDKAIDYPGFNPYIYCAANPLRYIDPTGMDPTEMEALMMAIHSYLENTEIDDYAKTLLNNSGWQISNMADDLTLNDESTGLNSMVFERTQDGQTEYAYVYAGTADNKDKVCDYALVNGVVHPQIIQALDNAQTIDERATDIGAKLTFVGHSLGGFLASTASRKTNRPAMTFNPAGTHPLYDAKLAIMPPVNVTNYVIMGASPLFTDPVFTAGAIHGIFPSGKIVPVFVSGILFPHKIEYFINSSTFNPK